VKRLRDLYTQAASEHVDRTSVDEPVLRFTFSKLTSEQSAEILARYQAGDRPVDIARDFGITEWTVQNVRKRAGVPTRPHGMNDANIDHAADLKARGVSIRQISKELGFDAKTVAKYLRLRGITI
jgi:DNA-binding CsgD family transcriptional regulator